MQLELFFSFPFLTPFVGQTFPECASAAQLLHAAQDHGERARSLAEDARRQHHGSARDPRKEPLIYRGRRNQRSECDEADKAWFVSCQYYLLIIHPKIVHPLYPKNHDFLFFSNLAFKNE